MPYITIHGKARLIAPALLLASLAACSGKEEPAASAAAPADTATAAPAPTPEPAVSAKVQSMDVEQLRDLASAALRDNRMYAPAGDNAMEYYLALRDKLPDDAAVKSALTDLQPYTLIAAEQSVTRENFSEAQRLVALIEKVDASAPALPRLKSDIENGLKLVVRRTQDETDKARRDAETRAKQLVEQQRMAQQQATEAAAAQQLAARVEAARQEAAREESVRLEAERQAAARREAEQRAAAAAAPKPAAAPVLRAVSTPAPRYPADALRSGTSGEVLLEISVGTDGSVTDARVLRSNPPRTFDREALNAVKRWKFEPISTPTTTRRTLAFQPNQ